MVRAQGQHWIVATQLPCLLPTAHGDTGALLRTRSIHSRTYSYAWPADPRLSVNDSRIMTYAFRPDIFLDPINIIVSSCSLEVFYLQRLVQRS